MASDTYVTLAIHTYHRANALKALLEQEGVEVKLQNVDLKEPKSSAGVRVRIRETDLPFALRIVENPEVFSNTISRHNERIVLVPIDFGPLSALSCRVAFDHAFRSHCAIHLMHAYCQPANALQLSDSISYDFSDSQEFKNSREVAVRKIEDFCSNLRAQIKMGILPPVTVTNEVCEGLPEDVIAQTSKIINPHLVVMATRGSETKERELIGSVTAEVLDTLRYPIFTVPPAFEEKIKDSANFKDAIRDVMMFVNFDQQDMLALDALHRFLPASPNLKIVFMKLEKKLSGMNAQNFHNLLNYAESHYPECHFSICTQTSEDLLTEFAIEKETGKTPDLIVVPNKKKNAFARLFNPGMAHRLLFQSDVPMMVVPV